MIKYLGIVSATALSLSAVAHSDEEALSSVLMNETEGCMSGPVAQFGRYIGDWDIADQGLQKDGVTWKPGNGARWNFTCVAGGAAVQDFWMPNDAEGNKLPGGGTNLRIYEPKTESWEIAWATTGAPGFTHINAKQNDAGDIVMHFVSPEQNPPRRIIFYTPTDEGWDWSMDMSFDGGENWTTVYKIKATPRK